MASLAASLLWFTMFLVTFVNLKFKDLQSTSRQQIIHSSQSFLMMVCHTECLLSLTHMYCSKRNKVSKSNLPHGSFQLHLSGPFVLMVPINKDEKRKRQN